MKARKPSIAFVVQRAGDEVADAALCLRAAQDLAPFADIEVLATCAGAAGARGDRYPPGHAIVDDVHVNRFPTTSALRDYVRVQERRFDRFGFFGYRQAATYETLPLVTRKSAKPVLWPLANGEYSPGLSPWNEFFAQPMQVVFSSEDERALFALHFPSLPVSSEVVTTRIPLPKGDGGRFRDRYRVDGPFVLFAGSLERDSDDHTLIEYFAKHQSTAAAQRRLVIVGNGRAAQQPLPGIMNLGSVDEQTKRDAIAAADLIVLPSPVESPNVVLEAWSGGKPVLVNAAAPSLVERCRRANGGLWYSNYDEFAASLDVLTAHVASHLGEQGRRFVERDDGWDDAVTAYRRILGC